MCIITFLVLSIHFINVASFSSQNLKIITHGGIPLNRVVQYVNLRERASLQHNLEKSSRRTGIFAFGKDSSSIVEKEKQEDGQQGLPGINKYFQNEEIQQNNLSETGISDNVLNNAPTIAVVTSLILGLFFILQDSSRLDFLQNLISDPGTILQNFVEKVADMGDVGLAYFALAYIIAESVAVPAIPLIASAGYLFGVAKGTAVVLVSGSIASAIGFLLGRFLFREQVEELLTQYPKFQIVDRLIGKEGFKLIILLRLAPFFPFALSNYFYGVTSIGFWPYFWATLAGFTPGTFAYVYTGTVGKALLSGGSDTPWYIYAGGLALLSGALKIIADLANEIVDEFDKESV